jgi:hypothetical protein
MGEAARLYRNRIGKLAQAIAITFGAHVVWVTAIAMIGLSLSFKVPVYTYFLFVPVLYIVGALPVSLGGIGFVEWLYLRFFIDQMGKLVQAGAVPNPSEVLALALLARLIPMFWGLPGAIVAVTGPKIPKGEALEAALGLKEDSPPDQA